MIDYENKSYSGEDNEYSDEFNDNTLENLLEGVANGEISLDLDMVLTRTNLTDLASIIKASTSLEDLDLSENNISIDGLKVVLDAILFNHSINKISITQNNIGDEGAKEVATLIKKTTSINCITINDNAIGDEGATNIANALKVNKSIDTLSIYNNNIGDKGAKALSEALKANKSLRALYLLGSSGNDITIHGAVFLDNAILCNQGLLFASYKNRSLEVEQELQNRRAFIGELIEKYNTRYSSAFKIHELAEYYNNMSGIKYINNCNHQDKIDANGLNNDIYDKVIYSIWIMNEALNPCLTQDVVRSISSICILPFNTKPAVLNIPKEVQMLTESSQSAIQR